MTANSRLFSTPTGMRSAYALRSRRVRDRERTGTAVAAAGPRVVDRYPRGATPTAVRHWSRSPRAGFNGYHIIIQQQPETTRSIVFEHVVSCHDRWASPAVWRVVCALCMTLNAVTCPSSSRVQVARACRSHASMIIVIILIIIL